MAHFLYWLDQGGLANLLHHTGPWAMVVGGAGAANVIGIAAILRHYDGRHRR